jgi:hypothetical protein
MRTDFCIISAVMLSCLVVGVGAAEDPKQSLETIIESVVVPTEQIPEARATIVAVDWKASNQVETIQRCGLGLCAVAVVGEAQVGKTIGTAMREALAMDMAAEASVRDYCALMGSLLSAAHKAEPLTPEGKAGLQAAVIEIMDLMTDIWKAPGVGPEDRVARNNIGHPFT